MFFPVEGSEIHDVLEVGIMKLEFAPLRPTMNPDIYGESLFLRSNIERIGNCLNLFVVEKKMLKENRFLSFFLRGRNATRLLYEGSS